MKKSTISSTPLAETSAWIEVVDTLHREADAEEATAEAADRKAASLAKVNGWTR